MDRYIRNSGKNNKVTERSRGTVTFRSSVAFVFGSSCDRDWIFYISPVKLSAQSLLQH